MNRILSIDIFRGLTVFLMILVNNPGNWSKIYPPFKHAIWNGLTLADLVFPFFLFIMGFTSYITLFNKTVSKKLYFKLLQRTIFLFLLGILLNYIPDFSLSTIRIPGILQRIAFVFLFTVISILWFQRYIIHIISLLLISYFILLMYVPVPSLGYPSIDVNQNIPAYIDNLLLKGHLWKYTKTWDPEGILSGISAIASSLFGVYYAKLYINQKDNLKKYIYHSIVLLTIGYIISSFYPINKSLWTGSYILVSTGYAILLFYILEWFLLKTNWSGTPFIYYGTNALASFFISSLSAKLLSIRWIEEGSKKISLQSYLYAMYSGYMDPYKASLLWAMIHIIIWTIAFRYLYKKEIFIKI